MPNRAFALTLPLALSAALLLAPAVGRAEEAASPSTLRERLAQQLANKQEPVRLLNRGRATAPAPAASRPAAAPPAWGYTGDVAPERWGELSPQYKLCAVGTRQSPIDLRDSLKVDLEPIAFDYQASGFAVQDTGRLLLVTPEGRHRLTVRQRTYELRAIEMRMPAEMLVRGQRHDAALHLLHRDGDGRLAMLALLLQQGDSAHPALQRLLNHIPLEKHQTEQVPTPLDFKDLLPNQRGYFTFMGSLTQPPCTEGVLWLVMREPLTVSSQQLEVLRRLYPMNARPVQPAGGRIVKESF